MKRAITITVIVLVAVAMSTSMIVPALAHNVSPGDPQKLETKCPPGFNVGSIGQIGQHPDHNANGKVCGKVTGAGFILFIDDLPEKSK